MKAELKVRQWALSCDHQLLSGTAGKARLLTSNDGHGAIFQIVFASSNICTTFVRRASWPAPCGRPGRACSRQGGPGSAVCWLVLALCVPSAGSYLRLHLLAEG